MKTIATFSNFAEAGFIQSVLQQEGIDSFLPEHATIPVGVHQILLQVNESDAEAASLIIGRYKTETKQVSSEFKHPSSGFPFLGITGFVMILWALFSFFMALFFDHSEQELLPRIGTAFATAVISLAGGFGIGAFIALICLICRPVWKKLKGA